jgi:hypothetical protein
VADRRVRPKQKFVVLGSVVGVSLLVIVVAGIMLATREENNDTINVDRRPVDASSPGDPSLATGDQPFSWPPATVAGPPATLEPATSPELATSEFDFPNDSATATSSSVAIPEEAPLPVEVPLPFSPTDDQPKSIRFAGTDRIALSEPLTSLDFAKSFTLEMWVRFEKGTNAHWLMVDLVLGNTHPDVPAGMTVGWQAWIMQTEGGKQRFAIATGKGFWAEYPATAESWRHLAVSGDGTTVAIYVDGRRAATQTAATLADAHIDSPLPVHFGSHNYMHPTQPTGMQGQLRAVRISTECRYRENFMPPPTFDADDATELVFDFRHVESSRQINDLSGHGRHGILWGAEWLALADADSIPGVSTVATPTPVSGTDIAATTATLPSSSSKPRVPIKLPPPPTSALHAARQRIEALLETEIAAARRPAEQLTLAAKLVSLAANLTYGKFLCLQMNQWGVAAAHLEKSDDELLKQAAAAELKTAEGAVAQSTAADLWYAARTSVDKNDLTPLLEHVLELSRTAAPGLKGIDKLSLEKRMQQIAAELPGNPVPNRPTNPGLPRFEPPKEFQSLVDGKLIGVLGGENATSDVYKLDLAKGEHIITWQLAGRDLAINSLRFTDAAEATSLVVYHDPMLLGAVRETPSRARLTVNMLGGP